MGDEDKTLLRLEVDSGQAKAALDQHVAQLQAVASAERQAAAAAQERASAVNLGIGAGSGSVITGGSSGFDFTGTASHQAAQAEAAAVKQTTDALRDQAIAEEYLHDRRQMAIGDIERRSANERAANLGLSGGNGGVVGGSGDIDALITGRTSKAMEDLNRQVNSGQAGREALAMILGRINPELGAMTSIAMRGGDALGLMFNPMTLAATAAAASVALLMAEIKGLIAENQRGLEVAKEAEKQMRELKKARGGDDENVRTTLGKAGIFDAKAIKQAKAIEEKFGALGVSRDKVREVLPFAIEGGLTDEQITELLGFQELGPGGLDAKDAKSRKDSMRQVSSFFKKNPSRKAEYHEFYGRRQAGEKQDLSQLDTDAISKTLMDRREAGSEEEAKQQAKDIANLMKYGKVETDPENFFWTHRGSDEYKMDLNSRQVQAAGRAARLGLADPKTANRLARGEYGDALGIKGTLTGFTPAPDTRPAPEAPPPRPPPPPPPPTREVGTVVNLTNYSNVFFPGGAGIPQREPRTHGL